MSVPAPALPDPVVVIAKERTAPAARLLAAVFVISAALSAFGWLAAGSRQFAFSYLVGFMYLGSLMLGSLFWVLIHHLTGAGWSVVLRRLWENNTRFIPMMAVLVLPILLLLPELYKWADPESTMHGVHGAVRVADDPLYAKKAVYLNVPFFIARFAFYYLVWVWISRSMARWSEAQDANGDSKLSKWMANRSSYGTVLLALTSTFFVVDFMMTLDYHWFSTIYGVYYWAGSINCAMASMVLTVMLLQSAGWLRNTITVEHLHDMGKIMFGFTIFWTYIGFSQFFLIWYANIPEETLWYQHRRVGGALDGNWNTVSWALLVCRFIIPFFWLIRRKMKRTRWALAIAAVWIMGIHYVDLYWQIMPNFHNAHDHPSGVDAIHFHWLDLTAPLAILSLAALWVVNREWPARPLIPVGDPRLKESLTHVNHW